MAQVFTQAQIEQYYCDGYLVARGLVDPAVCQEVIDQAGAPEAGSRDWVPRCFKPAEPQADAPLHRMLVQPRVMAAAEDLLEHEVRVYFGMLAVVRANGGEGLPWHQDNMYNTVLGRALNIFIALSRITPDMATLWVAPKSHLKGVRESQEKQGANAGHRQLVGEPEDAVQMPLLEPGDACVFDRNTLHRSLTNATGQDRYAYAAQFCEAKGRNARDGRYYSDKPLVRDLAALYLAAPVIG